MDPAAGAILIAVAGVAGFAALAFVVGGIIGTGIEGVRRWRERRRERRRFRRAWGWLE